MVNKRLILSAGLGIIGLLMLIGTIGNMSTPSPEVQRAQLEVNTAANDLVDTCFSALQNDDGSLAICDSNLKSVQSETCSQYSEADICNDGRVDQYFQMREQSQFTFGNGPTSAMDSSQQATVLNISDSVDVELIQATDLRCFEQRFMTYMVGDNSYYDSYTYIEKEHDQYCDPSNSIPGFQYRMVDVNQVMRWHNEGGYTGIYSEYRFLDDSVIILGEKEIQTFN